MTHDDTTRAEPVQRTTGRDKITSTHLVVWIVACCISVAIVTIVLSIWLVIDGLLAWRIVGTCIVVGSGVAAFHWVTGFIGNGQR